MFGGKDKNDSQEESYTSAMAEASSPPPTKTKNKNKNSSQITAYLGPDVHIEGKLRFTNSVLIEGTFKGEIESSGSLVIGENAEVDAQIMTKTITIKGSLKGSVEASERVELKHNGRLQGDVITPSLQMDETVFFQGSCSMPTGKGSKQASNPNPSAKPKTAAVEEIVEALETSKH